MPRVKERLVYKYEELSDSAKEVARDWYRSFVFEDSHDWKCIYEDAAQAAELFGLDILDRPVKLMNGKTRYEPSIYFSGFWSQGDGACFEGTYRYKKGALKAVMAEWPKDTELHRIVSGMQEVQSKHFYKLVASTKHTGRYYHAGYMSVYVEHYDDPYRDIGGAEEDIRQLLRDFADWIYNCLEEQYNWLQSDEVVEESLINNEYEFYEDGSIV